MYKVCSIFSLVLKLFSRGEFEKAVKEHQAERHARGFTSWGQFMAMLFCQLGRAHSLLEICGGVGWRGGEGGGKNTSRCQTKLMSLDGNNIDLALIMFDWTKFRQPKGAIKLHLR